MLNKRRLGIIAAFVIAGHGCLFVWMERKAQPARFLPAREKLVVQTLRLAPEKKQVAAAKQPRAQIKKSAPAKPQTASRKKEKKTAPKVSEAAAKKDDLIAQARKRLNEIGKKANTIEQAKELGSLKIDSSTGGSEDGGYNARLAACLRRHLRLPEMGEVRVLLTLDCQGNVVQVKILNFQNENNKRYVEKVLPTVAFPPFNQAFKNEKTHAFTLTLANDL